MENQVNTIPIATETTSVIYRKNVKLFLYIGTVLASIVAVISSFGSDAIAHAIGREIGIIVTIAGIFFALSTIGGAILSCIVTGNKEREGKVELYSIDKIWIEALIILALILASVWYSIYSDNYANVIWWYTDPEAINYGTNIDIFGILIRVITAFTLLAISLFAVVLSIARQIKANNGNYISTTFFKGKIDEFIKFMKSIFDETLYRNNPYRKKMRVRERILVLGLLGLIVLAMITYFSIFIPLICAILAIFLCIWFVNKQKNMMDDTEKIIGQIEQISTGNFTCATDISVFSPMFETSQRLRSIEGGFQRSVDKQIKSERMKIELVTNVSHDIKTPLTSVITYIDLLAKDDTLSAEARDYVNILIQKSERLKNIVADLFTLAKVTSGNEDFDGEVLDMTKLVVQTLGDMEDKIEESKFTIKANIPEKQALVWGDGKKLYRVLQNVIDNALKYALSGTRIFIDLVTENALITLTVKNISAYEIDFTAEQILERFARGDKSRTSEGNGLGLSIAKGFTQACGGTMVLDLDGDQFKVIITLPVTDKPLVSDDSEVIELGKGRGQEQSEDVSGIKGSPVIDLAVANEPQIALAVVAPNVDNSELPAVRMEKLAPSEGYEIRWNYLTPKAK